MEDCHQLLLGGVVHLHTREIFPAYLFIFDPISPCKTEPTLLKMLAGIEACLRITNYTRAHSCTMCICYITGFRENAKTEATAKPVMGIHR